MDKRYQVFVSSTYVDLQKERHKVIQTLMEMDCIPSGMELFPAADEEQWQFIQKIIDDCDYYLLIIGGRYGTLTPEGISYTEKEYDYALERGIKVIALIHGSPDEIPVGKTDENAGLKKKLATFRKKVSENRIVKPWTKAEELPGRVAIALQKTIKTYPAIGWVRASSVASADLLQEVHALGKVNDELKFEIEQLRQEAPVDIAELADLDDVFVLNGTHEPGARYRGKFTRELTWRRIFGLIGPGLFENLPDVKVRSLLQISLAETCGLSSPVQLRGEDFQTIKIQFQSLGLVNVKSLPVKGGAMALFWIMTPKGKRLTLEIRSIKKKAPETKEPAS